MRSPARIGAIVLTVGLLVWFAVPAAGQSLLPRKLGGISLGGLFPTGAFNQHVSQEGYGVAAYYAHRLGPSPFLLGGEISYFEYGHAHRVEYLQGIPEVGVDVDTSNSIAQGLLTLRFQPRRGRIVSFAEALAGLSYIWTESTIGNNAPDNWPIASETNFDDVTWTAGVGAGLSFRLRKPRGSAPEFARSGAFLELKVRYMAGGQAQYLKKGSIVVVGNAYTFTPERSATSFVTVQLGLSWFY